VTQAEKRKEELRQLRESGALNFPKTLYVDHTFDDNERQMEDDEPLHVGNPDEFVVGHDIDSLAHDFKVHGGDHNFARDHRTEDLSPAFEHVAVYELVKIVRIDRRDVINEIKGAIDKKA